MSAFPSAMQASGLQESRRLQAAAAPSQLGSLYEAQEDLELKWEEYMEVAQAQASYAKQQAAKDDEFFANYTAHLPLAERETVLHAWFEEKAQREAKEAERLYSLSSLTRKLITSISGICGEVIRSMRAGDNFKEFKFQLGNIRVGKTRNLQSADSAFSLGDPRWKLSAGQSGSYGWQNIQYTEVNPWNWAPSTPNGPFIVSELEVYNDEGTPLPVIQQSKPISLMTGHQSFAAATCVYWDWEANNGLGSWGGLDSSIARLGAQPHT